MMKIDGSLRTATVCIRMSSTTCAIVQRIAEGIRKDCTRRLLRQWSRKASGRAAFAALPDLQPNG